MRIPVEFLSAEEFELLSNNIVSRLYGIKIVGFGLGADDGIDGIDDILNPSYVVQSKKYQTRTSPSSFKNTIFKEIDKIKETQSKYGWNDGFQYIVVTSVELNPHSRKEIREHAGSLMDSDKNIIDGKILSDLALEKSFKELFAHFNLIDTSLSDHLKKIDYDCFDYESKDYFMNVNQNYYVETEVFYDAYHILDTEHLVILTGNPGVGKSSMSQMLGNVFASRKDNQYYVIERNIDEIQKCIDTFNKSFRDNIDKKLLIVFDDFLGRNTLDATDIQVKKVKSIYSLAKNSSNLYLVLNSRTQIVNTARGNNLEFAEFLNDKKNTKLTIDISSLTPVEKALIFRKNIERVFNQYGTLEKEIMNNKYSELLPDRQYRQIVYHKNFNPRLINLIAKNSINTNENYYDYCIKTLKNPSKIYDELFRKLSLEARYFLVNLFAFEEYPVKLSILEDAFNHVFDGPDYDLKLIEEQLEESWITIRNNEKFDAETIDFVNPSIIDYFNSIQSSIRPIMNNISSRSKYLSQSLKIDGYSGLNKKIREDYELYIDNNEYAGEKLNIIFTENLEIKSEELLELVYQFNSPYIEPSPIFKCLTKSQWDSLLAKLLDSKNTINKKLIIDELLYSPNNDTLLDNMLKEISIDIDYLAGTLDEILYELYGEGLFSNDLINGGEKISGTNLYETIFSYKNSQIQFKIDELDGLDNIINDYIDGLVTEDDISYASSKILDEYESFIFEKNPNDFFEDEFFDLSYHQAEEFIDEQLKDYLYYNNTISEDKVNKSYVNKSKITEDNIDSIFLKPLE